MCNLNKGIKREAKRLGIENRLNELDREYHISRGRRKPKDFVDLLEGAVC